LKWKGLIDARHLSIALVKILVSPIRVVSNGFIVGTIRTVVTGKAMHHSCEVRLLVTPQNTTWITWMGITANFPKDIVDANA
jgi:hypothetical protein